MQNREPQKKASEPERPTRRLKDVDAVERTHFLRAAAWLAPVSLIFFFLMTLAAGQLPGMSLGKALLFGFFLGLLGPWIAYGLLHRYVIGGTASLLGKLYYSGDSTPRDATSWRAQGLSVRGFHSEALQAFEEEAAEYPDDPGPCLKAAALCLQELDDPESAIRFFLRAREAAGTTAETDAYISVRLADIYEAVGSPDEVALELKRILQRHPDSEYARGTRVRLAALRRGQSGEPNSGESG
jgi:tetratricopeptide (TPR) repeat protein